MNSPVVLERGCLTTVEKDEGASRCGGGVSQMLYWDVYRWGS